MATARRPKTDAIQRMAAHRKPRVKAVAEPAPKKILVRRKKVAPEPLQSVPGSKEVRDRISEYVDAVVNSGRQFSITSRDKTVAVLAPAGTLPKGQSVMETVSTTDIKTGKRRMSGVAHFGPYSVERDGEEVAVLYAPTSSLSNLLERIFVGMDDLRLIDEGKARRVQLRKRADEAITTRIRLLRSAGDEASANTIEAAFQELDRHI